MHNHQEVIPTHPKSIIIVFECVFRFSVTLQKHTTMVYDLVLFPLKSIAKLPVTDGKSL